MFSECQLVNFITWRIGYEIAITITLKKIILLLFLIMMIMLQTQINYFL